MHLNEKLNQITKEKRDENIEFNKHHQYKDLLDTKTKCDESKNKLTIIVIIEIKEQSKDKSKREREKSNRNHRSDDHTLT